MRRVEAKVVIACVAVIVVLAVLAGFFFWKYSHLKNNPNAATEATTKRLVEKVGKLYALPTDEEPTIAEVKDKEKLKEQAFFQNADNGDYILIYTKSKIAILFREKENKLINVGPIALNQATEATQSQAKTSVKVINGSTTNGRAATIGSQITSKLGSKVSVDGNYGDAKRKNISKTIVVDVNGGKGEVAQEIASAIGGQVGSLPAGEDKPNADILVITSP